MKLNDIYEAKYYRQFGGLPEWVDAALLHSIRQEWVINYISDLRKHEEALNELYEEVEKNMSRCMPENDQQWEGCVESLDIDPYKWVDENESDVAGIALESMLSHLHKSYSKGWDE